MADLLAHISDPSLAETFADFVSRCDEVDLGSFVELVDESDYALDDWIFALLGFDNWLTDHKISRRNFNSIAGYTHCCQMMISNHVSRPDLKSFVLQCLSDYGYDAEEISQS